MECLRQLREGMDFEQPSVLLADLKGEQACIVPPGCPYSIATQVAHIRFWQDRWLGILQGLPVEHKRGKNGDFPVVSPEDWSAVREAFLSGLERACELGVSLDPSHSVRGKLTAGVLLTEVAVHNAYHVGQIALLRQLLGLWPAAGSCDAW